MLFWRALLREKVHQRTMLFKLFFSFFPEPLGEWRRRWTVTRVFLPSRLRRYSPHLYREQKKIALSFLTGMERGQVRRRLRCKAGRARSKQTHTHTSSAQTYGVGKPTPTSRRNTEERHSAWRRFEFRDRLPIFKAPRPSFFLSHSIREGGNLIKIESAHNTIRPRPE